MTDAEIIKALNVCQSRYSGYYCERCPLLGEHDCVRTLIKESLTVIQRQQAELDRLERHTKMHDEIQAEAVKEFADRIVEQLKESSKTYCEEYGQRENTLYLWDAIEIVKEMVGESDDR